MNDWNIISNKTSESESHDFELNPVLQGVLKAVKRNIGANNSTIYEVESKGKLISFWGSTVLDPRLEQVSIGDELRITYKGKKKSEKTGRTFKDYEVANRKPVVTFDGDWSK